MESRATLSRAPPKGAERQHVDGSCASALRLFLPSSTVPSRPPVVAATLLKFPPPAAPPPVTAGLMFPNDVATAKPKSRPTRRSNGSVDLKRMGLLAAVDDDTEPAQQTDNYKTDA